MNSYVGLQTVGISTYTRSSAETQRPSHLPRYHDTTGRRGNVGHRSPVAPPTMPPTLRPFRTTTYDSSSLRPWHLALPRGKDRHSPPSPPSNGESSAAASTAERRLFFESSRRIRVCGMHELAVAYGRSLAPPIGATPRRRSERSYYGTGTCHDQREGLQDRTRRFGWTF